METGARQGQARHVPGGYWRAFLTDSGPPIDSCARCEEMDIGWAKESGTRATNNVAGRNESYFHVEMVKVTVVEGVGRKGGILVHVIQHFEEMGR